MPALFTPKIKRILKILLLIYAIIGIAGYYLQDYFLLHPKKIALEERYSFTGVFEEINWSVDEQTSFHIVQFTVPDSLRKGVVLYFHGNQNNITRYARFVPQFTKAGYEVWMAEYPGFGKAAGKATEDLMYQEAIQVYQLARKKYTPQQIIIYGKSIGTGVASYLASQRDCRNLILETPYYSIASLLRPLFGIYPLNSLLHFQFPTYQYLPAVSAPITILHGTRDGVIRYSNAQQLQPLLKKGDRFITIEGGSHNNLNDYPLMQQTLQQILQAQ